MIRLKRTAKYIKKVDYDKDTGEILTASSILDIERPNQGGRSPGWILHAPYK